MADTQEKASPGKPEDQPASGNPQPPPQPAVPPAHESEETGAGFAAAAITRRWRREDMLNKMPLGFRGIALLFSLLAFIIMASNKHGYGKNFDEYEEYRYLLAIAILSSFYTAAQSIRRVHELSTGKLLFPKLNSALIDFFGDQIVAYLLISSASSAIPLTNRMRESADNIFTDSSASCIGMSFIAFILLASSALISGYNLSTQSRV